MDNSSDIKFTIGQVVANGELNCSNCKNYLSVGPVLYNSRFGNICGRKACALLASLDGDNSIQVLYESVVQFSRFPCRYRNAGCSSVFEWGDVEEHEEACEYKNFACPFLLNEIKCDWTGDDSQFLLHAKSTHPERQFENFRKIAEIPEQNQEYCFSNIVENIVLIMLYLDVTKNSLLCRIWGADYTRERLTYQIQFIDGTTGKSISMRAKEAEILHPRVPEDFEQKYSEISLNTIENLLTDNLHFGINFKFDNAEVKIGNLNMFLRRTFGCSLDIYRSSGFSRTCTYCSASSRLKSRNYVCSGGITICDNCLCSERFKPTDTLAKTTYNNMSLLSDRSCKNFHRGCDYMGSFFAIQAHHNICDYAIQTCTLCYLPVENLMAHAEQRHKVRKNGDSCTLEWVPSTKSQYIILFDGHLFFLNFEIDDEKGLTYEIDCAGMKEVRYNYVLEFVSREIPSAITMKNICFPGEISFKKYKISKRLSKKTRIPFVVLDNFFPMHDSLTFRTTMRKNFVQSETC